MELKKDNKNISKTAKLLMLIGIPAFLVGAIALAVFAILYFNAQGVIDATAAAILTNTASLDQIARAVDLADVVDIYSALRYVGAAVFAVGSLILFAVVALDQKYGIIKPIKSKKA